MRGDQKFAVPKEKAVLLALRVLAWAGTAGSQRHVLLHNESTVERGPLLLVESVCDRLELFATGVLRNETRFVPQVFGGLDVILEHEWTVAQLAALAPRQVRI